MLSLSFFIAVNYHSTHLDVKMVKKEKSRITYLPIFLWSVLLKHTVTFGEMYVRLHHSIHTDTIATAQF